MIASFVVLLIASAASPAPTQDKKPEPAAITPAPKPAFTGHVLFDGDIPKPAALPSTPEQTKGCCPGDKTVNVTDPSLVIDAKTKILPRAGKEAVDVGTASPVEGGKVMPSTPAAGKETVDVAPVSPIEGGKSFPPGRTSRKVSASR